MSPAAQQPGAHIQSARLKLQMEMSNKAGALVRAGMTNRRLPRLRETDTTAAVKTGIRYALAAAITLFLAVTTSQAQSRNILFGARGGGS